MEKKVVCLGKEFNSEEERREYYRKELRKKLPELKKIDGFPIGEDDDIIDLSDPPYYTACPNPWLNDFIEEWEKQKNDIPGRVKNFKVNEPYASDVREGKNNPFYIAHSYHTKVPHPAIMRFILHYTQPGDIIFDGFSGTGMTGIAAEACSDPDNSTKKILENEWKNIFSSKPKWGFRNAIQSDISTISSFIGYNYSTSIEINNFVNEATKIYDILLNKFSWAYKTKHKNNALCNVNYYIWSEMQLCNNCGIEFSYWDVANNFDKNIVLDSYNCPSCNYLIDKRTSKKSFKTLFDFTTKKSYKALKLEPVIINYTYDGKRYEKKVDEYDLKVQKKIEEYEIKKWFPINEIKSGDKTGDPFRLGITKPYQFYTKRNLIILSEFYDLIHNLTEDTRLKNFLMVWFTSCQSRLHQMNRYSVKHGRHVGPMANTLYVSATPTEISPFYFIKTKIKDNTLKIPNLKSVINQVRSAVITGIKDNTVDYIFTDPPFGSNIMYSELNIINESWLKILTNNKTEVIENKTQGKQLYDYYELLLSSFKEYFRILKPEKWMTVEFSNTSASVWNTIQNAIQKSGFIISTVFALNKGRGGLQAIIGPTAVNQDLIISCYKPSQFFEQKFKNNSSKIGVWDFVNNHLLHLPIHMKNEGCTTALIERSSKILFDRLITFYIMRGLSIPIDAKDFQEGLKQKFFERDGMYFTNEQANEYDEKKSKSPKFIQLSLLVTTESEGVEFLRQELKIPQTYQDLHTKWMQSITAVRKGDILPELRDILDQNFIQDKTGKWHVPDLNEIKDREALRNKVLMKEFNNYMAELSHPKAKKFKEVRVEALREGFKKCWEKKDFKTIVSLSEKIPQNILLEDEKLLMFYDIAKNRI